MKISPYEPIELCDAFHKQNGSINKHLLTIYSLAIGLDAKRIFDIGIGSTTRTLRSAIKNTKGELFSCDSDKERFTDLLKETDENWHLHLCNSEDFLKKLEPPFDFALHDGAHDYKQVKKDLQLILPLMRQYSIVCVHDTQHDKFGQEMIHAILDAVKNHKVSLISLPFSYGLTIIRIEDSKYEPNPTPWHNSNHPYKTECYAMPLSYSNFGLSLNTKIYNWLKYYIRPLKNSMRGMFK